MKIFFVSVLLSTITVTCTYAQVNITMQVPPTGIMQKSQLWNFLLVHTGEMPMNVSVQLSLSPVNDNTPVLTASTRVFTLTKGARLISSKDAAPVRYNYLSSAVSDRSPDGFLPIGNYMACYVVYSHKGEIQIEIAEDCVPIEIAPIAPPLLNMPEDNAVIETQYPQFNWLPPSPIQLFSDLSYDVVVVEILPGQSANDAIQQNMPAYQLGNHRAIFSNYPSSFHPLDTSKMYAWRVVAKNNGQFAAQSETWTFKVAPEKRSIPVPRNGNYILLGNSRMSGVNNIPDNVLGLKYYSFDKTHDGIIRFYDPEGKMVKEITHQLVYGDNYLAFRLTGAFEAKKIYLVEVADSRNVKHTALFRIQP